MKRIILGITGTLGAGKDSSALYLVKQKGFIFHSLSDILREELRKKNKKATLENLISLGNELRIKNGHGVLAKMVLKEVIDKQESKAVVVSIRHPEEVKTLKKDGGFYLLNIQSPLETRYRRIKQRGTERDKVSFEEFKKQERIQLKGQGGEANLAACLEMADFNIDNSGAFEDLHKTLNQIIAQI